MKTQYLIIVMFISLVLAGCSTSSDPSKTETPPSNGLKTVTLLDIPGISPPAIGAKPVTSIETEQYTATILWSPTPTNGFEDSIAYVSMIFLTPKVGYTLQGLTENSFTLTGALKVEYTEYVISVSYPMIPFTLTMITIPAGKFKRDDNAANISSVSSFQLSNKEITRAQFKALLGKDPSETATSTGIRCPVQQCNWYHAIAFCNKLSIAEGLQQAYKVTGIDFSTLTFDQIPQANDNTWNAATCDWNATGYRLPTEMERRWAAMGATQDSYPNAIQGGIDVLGYKKVFAGSNGSNAIGDYAWYKQYSIVDDGVTSTVGTKLPNELGLYDMSGNVAEWCWDGYDETNKNSKATAGLLEDYRGHASYQYRVSCDNWILPSLTSYTYKQMDGYLLEPNQKDYEQGFRVARRAN